MNKIMQTLYYTLIMLLIFSFSSESYANDSGNTNNFNIILTEEEEDYLNNNQIIKVANEIDWAPYDFVGNNHPSGIAIDYMNLLSEVLGITFEYINGYTWSELEEMFINKEIDILPIVVENEPRKPYAYVTEPYLKGDIGYATHLQGDLASITDFDYKKVAVVKSYSINETLIERFPNINIIEVNSLTEGLQAVSDKRADYYVDDVLTMKYYIDKNSIKDLYVHIDPYLTNGQLPLYRIASRRDLPLLNSILNKAMNAVTFEQKQTVIDKWSNLNLSFYQDSSLTFDERNWLNEHSEIKMYFPDAQVPISFLDDYGNISGIASEYINELEKRLDIKFVIQDIPSFKEGLDGVISGDIDIITSVAITSERKKLINYTTPYYELPIAIYSNNQFPYISNINDLEDVTVLTIEGYATNEWLKRDYPNLTLVEVKSSRDALKRLESGEHAVFIEEIVGTNRIIIQENYKNIQIVGETPYSYEVSVAVKKDWIVLSRILQKQISAIKAEKGQIIEQKWLFYGMKSKFNFFPWLTLFSFMSLIIITIILRNRSNKIIADERHARLEIMDKHLYLVQTDENSIITKLSHALIELLNINESDWIGKNIYTILYNIEEAEEALLNNSIKDINIKFWNPEGDLFIFKMLTSDAIETRNHTRLFIFQNITDKLKLIEQSIRDPLTGLYNRRYFVQYIKENIEQAKKRKTIFAFVIADIDRFKYYNDTYGHNDGDEALISVANAILNVSKPYLQKCFRLGGEEFGIILNADKYEEILNRIEEIRYTIENLSIEHEKNVPFGVLTISAGVLIVNNEEFSSIDNIYNKADKAMYLAKKNGRNQIKIYKGEN